MVTRRFSLSWIARLTLGAIELRLAIVFLHAHFLQRSVPQLTTLFAGGASGPMVYRLPARRPFSRLLKKEFSCCDRLSTNGKSPTTSSLPPFALSLSKGERRVFQHPVRGLGPGPGRGRSVLCGSSFSVMVRHLIVALLGLREEYPHVRAQLLRPPAECFRVHA